MSSEYFLSLNSKAQARYLEKISVIDGKDPYCFRKKDLSAKLEDFPNLNYIDLVNYLVYGVSAYTSKDFKAVKSLQAYKQFKCGWVSDVFVQIISGLHLVIGKVKHSQRLSEKPLQPWFIATAEGVVLSAHCTCMAGLGEACTHVAALMFYVQHHVLNIEHQSITSTSPYWGQPKKSVEFSEVKNINFSADLNSKELENKVLLPPVPAMDNTEFENLCEKLQAAKCNSAFLNVVKGSNQQENNRLYLHNLFKEDFLKKTLQELQDEASSIDLNLSVSEAETINRETILQSKSRKWFLYRAGRITASNLKSVCSTNINAPAISTIKKICYPSKLIFHSKATAWGCKHENEAKKCYVALKKKTHPTLQVSTCGLIINPDFPYLGASPDSLVSCECCGLGCVEIKCPYCIRDKTDKLQNHTCLEKVDGGIKLSTKHPYYFQIQCQLFVTKRAFCDFVLWKKNEIYVEKILPNGEFWVDVSAKAQKFFVAVILPEMLGKAFTEPCFSDGSLRNKLKSTQEKKKPTIIFL